jgi:hypothetical protein
MMIIIVIIVFYNLETPFSFILILSGKCSIYSLLVPIDFLQVEFSALDKQQSARMLELTIWSRQQGQEKRGEKGCPSSSILEFLAYYGVHAAWDCKGRKLTCFHPSRFLGWTTN